MKIENDIALQHLNPTPSHSNNIEELQQEIDTLRHELQLLEDQLKMFEPDPLSFTSKDEINSCEKNLLDTLSRITQRKDLLSNHLSPPNYDHDLNELQQYLDPNEGIPTSFETNVANRLPQNDQNSSQVCVASHHSSSIPRSTIYDKEASNINVGSCNIVRPNNVDDAWRHHNYTTTDQLLSSFTPQTSFHTSDSEELQQEVDTLTHELQLAEEQLRLFEPHHLSFTLEDEIDSCEKNLLDTLSRITQMKKDLLSDHLSLAYDHLSLNDIQDEIEEGCMNTTTLQQQVDSISNVNPQKPPSTDGSANYDDDNLPQFNLD
ncbi:hypothetical protein IC582_017101 [Cucumis melo]